MSVLAGKVTSITGMVQAKNPFTGEVRILKEGDEVLLGDIIVTSMDGNVTISLENGDLLTLGRDTQMAMDEDVVGAPGMIDPVTEGAVDVAALQQAVLEGNFEGLEETAAGGDAGPAGSANAGANSVDRIGAEGEVTSGYDTSTATTSSTFTQEQVVATEVNLILTAEPQQITEDETLIVYTATLDIAALTDMEVTLDNGVVITIPAGELSGSANFFQTPDSDVYIEADSLVVAEVSSTSGGGFNVVNITNDASTTVVDSIDVTNVTLTTTDVDENNGLVTFTAELSNPGETDVTVTTEHGDILISAGNTTGTIAVDMTDPDVYIDPTSVSATVSAVSGGNFESVDFESATATAQVADVEDITTVTLTTTDVDENNGLVTFTAELSNPGETDVTVTTEHGDILISAGNTTGTIAVDMTDPDVYIDPTSVSATVSAVSGGNFEAVDFEGATATAQVSDTIDVTNVTLAQIPAQDNTVPEGGTATYRVTVSNPPLTDMQLKVLVTHVDTSNGDVNLSPSSEPFYILVTIPAGDTFADFTIDNKDNNAIEPDENYQVELTTVGLSGVDDFEKLEVDETPVQTTIIDDDSCDKTIEGTAFSELFGFDYTTINPLLTDFDYSFEVGGITCITDYELDDDALELSEVIEGTVSGNELDKYLTFTKIDSDGDGTMDTTQIEIDSNGEDVAGGTQSTVYIDKIIETPDTWTIKVDDEYSRYTSDYEN
ncbi:MAG: retention module-containing protein [Pseudomonadota bacterium]|nr:retention module-containing protein [Pseudomonadota bacterium]